MNIERSDIHEKEIVELLSFVEIKKYYEVEQRKKIQGIIHGESARDYLTDLERFIGKLKKVKFSDNEVMTLENMLETIEVVTDFSDTNIPTPIPEINEMLNGGGKSGGIARQAVTIYAARVNEGKSIGAINFAVHAAKQGYKTLFISLEGKKRQPVIRAISNLTELQTKMISSYRDNKREESPKDAKSFFGAEMIEKIKDYEEKYGDRIRLMNLIDDATIENISSVVKERYQEEKFDLLVVDYGQLVRTNMKFAKRDQEITHVFRELEILSTLLNIATLVPMQFNREGQKRFDEQAAEGDLYVTYDKYHIAECINAVNTADCMLSWNATKAERASSRGRVAILKQRDGVVDYQVGIEGRWDVLNPFKGKVYYKGFGDANSGTEYVAKENIKLSFKGDGPKVEMNLEELIQNFPYLKSIIDLTENIDVTDLKGYLDRNKSLFLKRKSIDDTKKALKEELKQREEGDYTDIGVIDENILRTETVLSQYEAQFEDMSSSDMQKKFLALRNKLLQMEEDLLNNLEEKREELKPFLNQKTTQIFKIKFVIQSLILFEKAHE